jgi:hypothetical protein
MFSEDLDGVQMMREVMGPLVGGIGWTLHALKCGLFWYLVVLMTREGSQAPLCGFLFLVSAFEDGSYMGAFIYGPGRQDDLQRHLDSPVPLPFLVSAFEYGCGSRGLHIGRKTQLARSIDAYGDKTQYGLA